MRKTVTSITELRAAPAWRTLDFISDLHLQAGAPATFTAWRRYMQSTPADAVFILGDLFEAWVGDDSVGDQFQAGGGGFEDRCARVLVEASSRLALFFMHGNRDFLVGRRLMDLCHVSLLNDATLLVFPDGSQQSLLLSHGDALCTGDLDYMRFRREVRSPRWQHDFLVQPLAARHAIARALRQQSEEKKSTGVTYADVDTSTARRWLQQAGARTLIHGHTHKPAGHDMKDGLSRVVLSDWDAAAPVPRAQVLRLSEGGLQRINLAITD